MLQIWILTNKFDVVVDLIIFKVVHDVPVLHPSRYGAGVAGANYLNPLDCQDVAI
jgi:hypothetical protein